MSDSTKTQPKAALLVLEDNTVIRGQGFGACTTVSGELVFTTAMVGYEKAITDPSYGGQILAFSSPHIGNYGFQSQWGESKKIQTLGVIVRNLEENPADPQNVSLDQVLLAQNVPGISGIDTRSLIRKIRTRGTIQAVLSVFETPQRNFTVATQKKIQVFNPAGNKTIGILDYGAKQGIITECLKRNAKVIVFPQDTPLSEIVAHKLNGIILSNGPGDPREYKKAVALVQSLIEIKMPIFGICLGHQLLSLAAGAKVEKLLFGNRGLNQPVKNVLTHQSFLTSQNHGYAVQRNSLSKDWQVLFTNLNDQTVEGIKHITNPWFSVQFHPEANPGPRDNSYLFDDFMESLVK